MGIECDLHHRDHRQFGRDKTRTQPQNKKTNNKKSQKRQRHESEVHRCVTAKMNESTQIQNNDNIKGAQHKGVRIVINNVLLGGGGRDMRSVVMPLRSCSYMVMLTSLRESFMGGEKRKMARSRRERKTTGKSQHQKNITAISSCFLFKPK